MLLCSSSLSLSQSLCIKSLSLILIRKNRAYNFCDQTTIYMAVEARLSLFPSQLVGGNINNNREMMIENNVNFYSNNNISTFEYGGLPPLSGTTTENLLPMYSSVMAESVPAKAAIKAESGVSYALPPASRKRPRDSPLNQFAPYLNNGQIQLQHHQQLNSNNNSIGVGINGGGCFTFLGEDISYQIQQQQIEIDVLIAQHTEKLRREVEERRRRCTRRIIAAVEEGVMKKLRVKEEEMEKIGKLNYALEERVRSLCVENQIWRELAHNNQATANALRSNLEQVIAQVHQNNRCAAAAGTLQPPAPADLADDAESCCGSNFDEAGNCGGERDARNKSNGDDDGNGAATTGGVIPTRMCRQCGKEESCVLLLPCRHLCLCTVCGSSVHVCPVCNTAKNASVHVNMSSSC